MKAIFVHDHRFLKKDDVIYTSGGLPEKVLLRYVDVFGELMVAGRLYATVSVKEENCISDARISFLDITGKGSNKRLKQAIREADIVIARVPAIYSYKTIIFAYRIHKPLCVEVVGDAYGSYFLHGGWKGKLSAFPLEIIQKACVKHASYVVYVSRFFLQKKYPTNGATFASPDVSFELPTEDVLKQRLCLIKTITYRTPVIGLIGFLDVNYRGHGKLIRAVSLLKEQGIRINVRFLGAGSPKRWLDIANNLNVEDQVEFSGTLGSGKPVMEWIDGIDILAMPTKQETLGRAIVEAMSRGCPVLGSIETAIWEQIGSDCLFKADDDVRLAEMIRFMISHPDYMALCARENFWRSYKYDSQKCDKRRLEFFEKMKNEVVAKRTAQ